MKQLVGFSILQVKAQRDMSYLEVGNRVNEETNEHCCWADYGYGHTSSYMYFHTKLHC